MILSEFAGAAQSLNGSLLINPWDVQSTADAINVALGLSAQQRYSNWQKLWAVGVFGRSPLTHAVRQQIHLRSVGRQLYE